MDHKTQGEIQMAEKKENDKNRIIFLSGNFDEHKAKNVINEIIRLESEDPTKDILLMIDSYGGYVHSFMAIHDFMKHVSRCNVITLGIGKQMSCGQMLLMSGTKGKRFSTPNSRVLMHQLSAGTFGKLSEMEVDIEENKRVQQILEKLVLKYTKVTKKQFKDLMQRDSYLSSQEALDYGIIDAIIQKPTDIYKHPSVNL